MTAEEKARELAEAYCLDSYLESGKRGKDNAVSAILEAIAWEREGCAKVADGATKQYWAHPDNALTYVAAAIRARGAK